MSKSTALTYKSIIIVLSFLFVIWLSKVLIPSVAAQQAGPMSSDDDCDGLDIVLIIDQSGSMGGTDSVPANDPDDFRIASVHAVIDQLGDNRLYFCPTVVHRLGVVSFGDGPKENDGSEVELEFTEIKPDPNASLTLWQSTRQALKEQITPKNLGATDFATGFATAKEMFDALPSLGTVPRKRALILLSDGGPCLTELGCRVGNPPVDHGPYLQELKSQVQHDFPFVEGEVKHYLWVVAMHDLRGANYLNASIQSINQTLEAYWKEIAETHGGTLTKLSKNREDLPATFFVILTNLIGTGSVKELECGPGYIEPYTERTIFTFFKSQTTLGVGVEYRLDDETVVRLSNGEVSPEGAIEVESEVAGHIERYVISRPGAGVWMVTSDNCDDAKIYREAIVPEIILVGPTAPLLLYDVEPFYDPNSPHYLTYEIRERSTGNPFAENQQYPLRINVNITSPSGETFAQTLSLSDEATYRSTEPLPVGELGSYQLVLNGETDSADPTSSEPLRLFEEERATYTVRIEMRTFDFEVLLEQNARFLLVESDESDLQPLQVQWRLMDEEGNSLEPARIFTDADSASWFAVTLTHQDGTSLSGRVSTDASDASLLTATFDGALKEGQYTLQVVMTGEYRQDRYQPLQEGFSRNITLSTVQYVNLALVVPQEGEVQSLNEVRGGASHLVPVAVKVQLVDSSGQVVEPATVFQEPLGSLLTATLYGPEGMALASTALEPDLTAGPGNFLAQFPGEDVEGSYRIQVELLDTPTNEGYELIASKQSVGFSRVRTEPFDFRIWAPTPNVVLPVHQSGFACLAGEQLFPTLELELTSATGEPLDKEKVLEILTPATSPPTARLIAPDGTDEEIELQQKETPNGLRLVGVAQSIPALTGEYKFEVSFAPSTINPRFAPLEPTRQLLFSRSDSWLTNPLVCRGGVGLMGLIVLLLLIWAIWSLCCGPKGTLMLVENCNPNNVIHSWTLRGMPRVKKLRHERLEEAQVKEIRVSRADPINPDVERAIQVKGTDLNGELFLDTSMEPGDCELLVVGIDLYYQ